MNKKRNKEIRIGGRNCLCCKDKYKPSFSKLEEALKKYIEEDKKRENGST